LKSEFIQVNKLLIKLSSKTGSIYESKIATFVVKKLQKLSIISRFARNKKVHMHASNRYENENKYSNDIIKSENRRLITSDPSKNVSLQKIRSDKVRNKGAIKKLL